MSKVKYTFYPLVILGVLLSLTGCNVLPTQQKTITPYKIPALKPIRLPTQSPKQVETTPLRIYFAKTSGDFVVLEDQGNSLVINSGFASDESSVSSMLSYLGLKSVNYMVATNNLSSSIGGFINLLSLIPSTYYLSSNDVSNGKFSGSILNWFGANNVVLSVPGDGSSISFGGATVSFYDTSSRQDGSLLVVVNNGGNSFVFSGSTTRNIESSTLSSLPVHSSLYVVTNSYRAYHFPRGILATMRPKTVLVNNNSGLSVSILKTQVLKVGANFRSFSNGLEITSNGISLKYRSLGY